MKKQQTFKVPNALICGVQLTLTARIVATVLYAHCTPLGYCHKSLNKLSALSGCSVSTIGRAMQELEEAGWITAKRTYVWSIRLGRRVYGPTEYSVKPLPKKGWTYIPRDYLKNTHITPSAFVIGLYLYMAASNRERRAFPSISKIAAAVGVAERTVCRALHQIRRLKEFLVTHCRRLRGGFAANNYHLCRVISVAGRECTPSGAKQRTTKHEAENGALKQSPLSAFVVRLKQGLCNLLSGFPGSDKISRQRLRLR